MKTCRHHSRRRHEVVRSITLAVSRNGTIMPDMASASARQSSRNVIGVMTGTSIDGMDVALVRIRGAELSMTAELISHRPRSLGEIGPELRRLADGAPMTAAEIAQLAWSFGELHAEAIEALITERPSEGRLDLIAVHGQTVYHQPPLSWQLINPAPIAVRLMCPVIFDLRQQDLAAGGQGAPITPLADWVLFRHAERRRAIVNLGGFCNITILPPAPSARIPSEPLLQDESAHREELREIDGFDLCVCNHLLDAIAREALFLPYDDRGSIARSGSVVEAAAIELRTVLSNRHDERKSLGTGDERLAWVRTSIKRLSGPDLAATAVHAVGQCISQRLNRCRIDEVILAGGGTRNDALVEAINTNCSAPITLSDALGIPAEAREAAAMAVLGALSIDGIPITLPHITGCRSPAPLAGARIAVRNQGRDGREVAARVSGTLSK
jgi:anhydro-N-acetylmuramic acid kinase